MTRAEYLADRLASFFQGHAGDATSAQRRGLPEVGQACIIHDKDDAYWYASQYMDYGTFWVPAIDDVIDIEWVHEWWPCKGGTGILIPHP